MGFALKNYLAAFTPPASGEFANAIVQGTFAAVGPGLALAFQGWANFALWCSYKSALTTVAGSLTASNAAIGAVAAGEGINSTLVPSGTTVAALTSGNSFTMALPTITMAGKFLSNGQIIGLPSTQWLLGATVAGPNIPAGTTVVAIVTAAVNPPSYPGGPATLGVVQLSATPTGTLPTVDLPVAFTFALAAQGIAAGTDNNALFTGADITLSNTQVNLERSFDGGLTWITCNTGGTGTLTEYTTTPINVAWAEPEVGVGYRFNCVKLGTSSGVTLNYRLSQSAGAASALTRGGVV
jgi:hypothetical protein